MTVGVLSQVADIIDPDARPDQPELSDPVALASHLDATYQVRAHLTLISAELAGLERGDFDRLMVNTPPRVGKPVYAGTMVLMGDGSRKRIDEIEVGDTVITHTGQPRRVSAVHRQGILPVVRITTNAGRSTVAALDHPFLTPGGWVEAGDLRVGQSLAVVPRPSTLAVEGLLPEEARLLGYFIGDGSASQNNATVTTASPAVVADLQVCADALGFGVREYKTTDPKLKARNYGFSGGVRPWLIRHGVAGGTSWTKRVPDAVFASSPEIIAQFVGAYWDCDGVVSSRGKTRGGEVRPDVMVELYSVSRDLLADVQHLLVRLGIRSLIRRKIGAYQNAEHVSWRLQLSNRDDVARFRAAITLRHERRASVLASATMPRTAFDGALMADPIVSIEAAGEAECLCLTVDVDHTFTSDDLVVHNTRTAVEWFAFWWLCKHPTERIIIGCYGDELAARAGGHVRRLVEHFGAAYGLVLERGSAAKKDWALTTGGGVRSVGVGSGVTGHDGDVIIIDDPTKSRAEAESTARRDAIFDWYSADIGTRVMPNTRILLVQTPWHPDDLRARVVQQEGNHKDGGRWRVVVMAALAEDPDDPLGRAWGEPLPHPRIKDGDTARLTKHWESLRSARAPRDWRALYQCDPKSPEGQLVKADLLRERRCFEHGTCDAKPQRAGVAVDPSGGGRDSAGVIGGYLGEDGRAYWTHDRSGVMAAEDWARAACEVAQEIEAEFIVFEANYGGDMARLTIRTAWEQLRQAEPERYGFCPRIIDVHARKGKVLRAEPIAQQIVEDRVRTAKYLPDLESEWSTWVVGPDSPGRIDASVYLAYELLPMPSSGTTSMEGAGLLADTDLLAGLWRT